MKLLWTIVAVSLLIGAALIAWVPPAANVPGQKIFYVHMPIAVTTLAAAAVCFIASAAYLARRRPKWDDLALASARATVILCSAVLITGIAWAKLAWLPPGQWWTWSSPRLTFSLALWLLYVVYLLIRPAVDSRQRAAVVSAAYGVIAFLDVPLIYLSARLLRDIHPRQADLGSGAMKLTLAWWFLAAALLATAMIATAYRRERRRSRSSFSRERQRA